MTISRLSEAQTRQISELVDHFVVNRSMFSRLVRLLRELFTDNDKLSPYIHSMKWRVKDPEHLRVKLALKLLETQEKHDTFDITKKNLFEKINDLAAGRILHLHTTQIETLNKALIEVLDEARYNLIEGPIAFTWDDETREYFKTIGIQTRDNPRMYTSVHYVIEANTKTRSTCEIQVRTLAEELWGEVDHTINYPIASDILACREQIKVLARVASSCTRLVDAIFKTYENGQKKGSSDISHQIVP